MCKGCQGFSHKGVKMNLQLILVEPPSQLYEDWTKSRLEYYNKRVEPTAAMWDVALEVDADHTQRLMFSIQDGKGNISKAIWSVLLSNPELSGLKQINGDNKDAKDPKATPSAARRDSPLRNVSPKGVKPRRASPVRKQGPRDISRSPEPPRARPPSRDVQASPAGGGDRNEPTDELAQPTSFVQSLARLALVLERNGQAGTGAAAAATAVAAVVAKQGDDGLGDIHQYLQSAPASNRQPREAEQLRSPEEAILRARCARLEHEVAELRVQLSRRLDQAAIDVAASRQAAETATAQVAALRAELAAIIGQNGEEVKQKFAAEDQARHWPQQLI
eukprot:s784_g2.t1